jgi:hypothetical protein
MNETQVSQALHKKPGHRSLISLRTKIITGNLLIVLIIAAMGYFVFYRSQATTIFLLTNLISVSREIVGPSSSCLERGQ